MSLLNTLQLATLIYSDILTFVILDCSFSQLCYAWSHNSNKIAIQTLTYLITADCYHSLHNCDMLALTTVTCLFSLTLTCLLSHLCHGQASYSDILGLATVTCHSSNSDILPLSTLTCLFSQFWHTRETDMFTLSTGKQLLSACWELG